MEDFNLSLLQYTIDQTDIVVDAQDEHAALLIKASEYLINPDLAKRLVFRDRLIPIPRLVETCAHSVQCDQMVDHRLIFLPKKVWYVTDGYINGLIRYVVSHGYGTIAVIQLRCCI